MLYDKQVANNEFPTQQWRSRKYTALKRGLEFSIDRKDFLIPEVCPVLGIRLDRSSRDHTPSLDRRDNSIGYTKENTIVVSWRANRIKSDASIAELRKLANFYGAE